MALNRSFTYRLHVLHKLTDMKTQHAYENELGMTLSDGRALSVIGTFGPLSVNDLAFKSNLNKGQASRAAQSLVEQKLVDKYASGADGRGVVLSLNTKGKKLYTRVMALVERRNLEILSALSAEEQQQLNLLFDRLITKTQQQIALQPLENKP
jgi:DNA-binding MarR family transcriptional regulator